MPEPQEAIKPKILIVEDEAIIAIDLKSRLEQLGYTVLAHVNSAEKALELEEQELPDLVFIDIVLKGKMDGIEAADIIHSRWGVPLVFVTTYADEERLKRANLAYSFGYILKPFSDNVIKGVVKMAMYVSKVDMERRKAEEELRQEKEFAESMIEMAQVIILVLDPQGRILRFNPYLEKISGYSLEEVKGKDWFETFLPERIQEDTRELFLKAISNIQTRGNVNLIVTKDGEERYVEWYDKTIKNTQGSVVGLLAVGQDITERKRMEKALRESEDQYRDLVESSRDLICIHDLTGKILWVNEEPIRILGYDKDFILKMNIRDFLASDRKDEFDEYLATMRSQGVASGLLKTYTAKGEERIWEYYNTIRTEGVAEPIVRGMAHDVTERMQAERKLRVSEMRFKAQYQGSPISTIIWREKGETFELTDYNQAAKVATRGEVIKYLGKTATEMYRNRQEILQDFHRCFTEKKVNKREVRSQHFLPGRTLAVTYVFVPPDLIMVHAEDITDRKQAEEKIRASLKEKEILLQEIHHRVKNNLQLISSLLGIQSRYLEDEKSREILRESQNRVRVMANIHTMLYQSEDLSRVDFGCFIKDLTGRLQQSYGIAGSSIEVHVDMADLSLNIETSIPCGLILNELVSNALRHAFPEGRGGEVNINMTKAGDRFVVKVQDNGIGFPNAVDFQNPQTLGLELVRLLVEQIDGTIDLHVERGTTFTITFPTIRKGG